MDTKKGSHLIVQRKRMPRTHKDIAFNLNPPALNLSMDEYNKMWEEIKNKANIG